MNITKNIQIQGAHNKPILVDVFFKDDNQLKPIIIFCHGYKGFKDWGSWNIMAEEFANLGFCFVKFNFAYNGGTIEQPIDFPDLEAFGNNNYTKELDDLDSVLNWLENNYDSNKNLDLENIILVGHSRGGGIVTIKAEEDSRVSKVISLGGVSDFGSRFPCKEALEQWEKKGVYYVKNGRTKQNMPHFYQFYKDFKQNEKRLTIKRAASNLKIPHLIIHGDADTSVSIDEAHNLHKWNPNSTLKIIEKADHVFNSRHPWEEKKLPQQLLEVIETICKWSISESNR